LVSAAYEKSPITFSWVEGTGTTQNYQLIAHSSANGVAAELNYVVEGEDHGISLNSQSGLLSIAASGIDFEGVYTGAAGTPGTMYKLLSLVVRVSESTDWGPQFVDQVVNFVVKDINEAPVFADDITCTFKEVTLDTYDGMQSCSLTATDEDNYSSNPLSYNLGPYATDFHKAAYEVHI
jgi:hypothetical protein